MVVLGRQQLLTENTISVVLPVMACFNLRNLGRLARMWGIVLGTNLAGTLIAALFCSLTPVIGAELRESMISLSRGILEYGWIELFFRGISAGFLMAAMVRLVPSAATAEFYVIVLMTYLISVGNFAHVIAGSIHVGDERRSGNPEDRRGFSRTGSAWQHCRGHRTVCRDLTCAVYERGLGGATAARCRHRGPCSRCCPKLLQLRTLLMMMSCCDATNAVSDKLRAPIENLMIP